MIRELEFISILGSRAVSSHAPKPIIGHRHAPHTRTNHSFSHFKSIIFPILTPSAPKGDS